MQHRVIQTGATGPVSHLPWRRSRVLPALWLVILVLVVVLPIGTGHAAEPLATIGYQPMTSEGLAAGHFFEVWVLLDKSMDPAEPGYALPGGAVIRVTFPAAFTPVPGVHPEAVLLYGWPQKAIPVRFTVAPDPQDPRTIVITLDQFIPAAAPERPGLKAIHLRTGERNPGQAGDYPITLQFNSAGPLTGTRQAIAHITAAPVPVITAYNQLHNGQDEDWQHVKLAATAPLPMDLLVTLPHEARSAISLRPAAGGDLEILSDGEPIGEISRRGVPVALKPEAFGPGFARLGIVRFEVQADGVPGVAEIDAQLNGGPPYALHVVVER